VFSCFWKEDKRRSSVIKLYSLTCWLYKWLRKSFIADEFKLVVLELLEVVKKY